MNVADEHSRWDEDLAAYAVGALDAHETVSFAAHLADCDRCSAELHRLMPAVELLPVAVEQLAPPPALRGRIMDAIGQETAPATAGHRSAPRPRRARWRERLHGWNIALPAALTAAALAAAFAIGFVVRGGDTTAPQRTTVPVAATSAGTPVSAQLVSDGGAWHLDVTRMPRLPAGRVYQAWVMRSGRGVEPSTVFVLSRDGSTTVAIPQSLKNGDKVLVTREPRGGSSAPTTQPLLQAQV